MSTNWIIAHKFTDSSAINADRGEFEIKKTIVPAIK